MSDNREPDKERIEQLRSELHEIYRIAGGRPVAKHERRAEEISHELYDLMINGTNDDQNTKLMA